MMRELGKVTFQARQFLGDIGAVGEEGNFFEQTFVVTGNGQTCLFNTIEERCTVPFDHIGVKRADFLKFFPHRLQPMNQILGEMPAFALAHFDQIRQRGAQRAVDCGPYFFGVHLLLWKTHHTWSLKDGADRDFARGVQFLLQRAHSFVVGAGELRIKRKVARAVWAVVKSNDDVRSSARNIFIDRLANARLELGQIARQIDYDVALLSIHRIEFDAKFCSVVMDLGAAVTSHASHNRSASRKSREITNRNKRRNLYCFLSYESAPAAKRGECARAISALAADGASCCDCRGRWVGLSASASCRLCLGRSAARNRQSIVTNLFRLTGDLVRRKNRGLFPGHEHGFLDRVSSFREQGGGLPQRQHSAANSGCVACLVGFAAAESPGSVARGTDLWNS